MGQTYLRGYQTTDAKRLVTFKTIFPGWYSGRTVHLHVMIRTFSSSGMATFEFTTQLFFDPALTLTIMGTRPYNTRGNPDTTNSSDNIYNSVSAGASDFRFRLHDFHHDRRTDLLAGWASGGWPGSGWGDGEEILRKARGIAL